MMRASDLFEKPAAPVRKYRTSINPPYKRKDYLTLAVTLFLLLAIPLTVIVATQARDIRKSAEGPSEQAPPQPQEIEFVSNEILIRVKKSSDENIKSKPKPEDTGIASLNDINKTQKATKFQKSFKVHKKTKNKNHPVFRWYKVTLPGEKEIVKEKVGGVKLSKLRSILAKYKKNPNVEEVQLNLIAHATALPNDTYIDPDPDDDVWSTGAWGQTYEDMWGLKKIQADQAWDFAGNTNLGEGVIIAVVDTGLDYNHEDIANNVWINPGEDLNSNGVVDGTDTCPTPNGDFNCIDDDGNELVDDIRGWDFASNDNNPIDGDGHGSHVSGTAAAEGNNGVGIAGVAPKAQVMAIKSLPDSGSGEFDQLGAGIVYAADNGADVVNNSWGCTFACPVNPFAEDAVSYAYALDVVVIFSAGNDFGEDVEFRSPQNMNETIVISASDHNDDIIIRSNIGFGIDVSAPGGGISPEPPVLRSDKNILSLKANGTNCGTNLQVGTDYCRFAGTSMSSPHVAGLAALIREKHPEFTNEQVRQVIRVSADDIADPGFDINSGYGRINASAALAVDNPLNVNITSPARLTNFNGLNSVDIEGTASGTGFVSYSLSYGVGLPPSEFLPISGPITTPVTNGTLGTWDVSSVTDSQYYIIKLSATDGVKTYVSHVVVINELANPASPQTLEQKLPDVSENKVVWEAAPDPGTFPDIYLYNFTTGEQTQLTDESAGSDRGHVSISGDKIVWHDDRDGVRNVFLHDIYSKSTAPIIDDGSARVDPDIDGNKVVWKEGGDIYVYDLDTAIKTQITSDPSSQQNKPKISGNRIVWEDRRSGNNDIFLYDLDNPGEVQIASSGLFENNPDIFGDKIVYDKSGNIFMYDIPSGSTIRVNNPSCPVVCTAAGAKISDNRIVWTDRRGLVPDDPFSNNAPTTDIWLYDIALGVEKLVTPNLDWQQSPAISATKIVWQDLRTDTWQVFYTDIPGNNAPKLRIMYPDVPITAGVGDPPQPKDTVVNITDIGAVVNAFGKAENDPNWHSWFKPYDLVRDGVINISDIGLVVLWFGSANWPPGNSETDRITVPVGGTNVQFYLTATDPDTTSLPTITASGLPAEATFTTEAFTTPGGDTFMRGFFFWDLTTTSPSGQTFDVTFTADDDTDTTELTLYIVR